MLIGSGQSFGLPCSLNLLGKGVTLGQVKNVLEKRTAPNGRIRDLGT